MSIDVTWRGDYPSDIPTALSRIESDVLVRYATGKRVLEVGSWHGYSTVVMARVADSVTAVDWHMGDKHAGEGSTIESFTGNLRRYGVEDKVDVKLGLIEDIAYTLPTCHYDMAFLDAYHTEAAVFRHLLLMYMLVKSYGYLLAHDYGREIGSDPETAFGVHRGVEKFLRQVTSWEIKGFAETVVVLGAKL